MFVGGVVCCCLLIIMSWLMFAYCVLVSLADVCWCYVMSSLPMMLLFVVVVC